jgi:hypothetical protein
MKTKALSLALPLLAAGCMSPTAKVDPLPDVAAGKADGSLEVVDNGPVVFGEDHVGDVEPGLAQAWSFELSGPAELRFETAAGAEADVDTVVHVHEAEGLERAVDDDGGPGLYSDLSLPLEAGRYRVTVTGYGRAVGTFALRAACEGEGCGGEAPVAPVAPVPPEDPWALARDVDRMHVEFTEETPIPERYARPEGTSPVSLSSPEWWQRWSGGETQSFSWSVGTDFGKRCGQASAIRLQAIWEHEVVDAETGETRRPGREAFEALLDGSGWRGTMYNWTEDVSEGGFPVFSPASMWAWRTGAIKWIHVVHPDGSCDLPTLGLVQDFAERCLAQAAREDGEIQGCRASAR